MNGKLTREEFTELVKERYLKTNSAWDQEDMLRYFNEEEAQDHIKAEYDSAVKAFDAGKLGAEGFRVGKVAAVANCLSLMYE